MEIGICLIAYLLNLGLLMMVRKNKHHERFFQFLGLGITAVGSEYVIFERIVFWALGKEEAVIAGILMLVVASVFIFVWTFRYVKTQKYYVGRQELIFGIAAALLMCGLIIYRKLYLSIDGIQRALLWLGSGYMFLSLIMDKVKKNNARVVGFLMSLLVMFGHPLTNVLFGNLALSVAMNWVLADLVLIQLYKSNKLSMEFCELALVLEAVFFAVGYPAGLLMLLVMTGPLLYFMCRNCKESMLFTNVISITVTAVVTIVIAMVNIVITAGSLKEYYVYYRELQGAVFSNVWSDVGFMVFPILLYIYYRIDRKRHLEQLYWPIAALAAYIIILQEARIFQHPVYDGYNQLYLVWLLFMYVGVTGLIDTFAEFRTFLVAYVCTIMCVFVLMLSGIEQTLHDMNVWYCVEVKADAYLKVFDWNWKALKKNNIPPQLEELIEQCEALRAGDSDMVIPCMIDSNLYRIENFYRRTGQEEYFRHMYMLQDKLLEAGQEQQKVWDEDIFGRYEKVPYVMVETNSKLYWYGIGIYGYSEKVYENEYGAIYKLRGGE